MKIDVSDGKATIDAAHFGPLIELEADDLRPQMRNGRGSILITSQLPVTAWHEVIDEPTFADAILDRLVHNAYRLELEGHSMRRTADGPTEKVDEGHPA